MPQHDTIDRISPTLEPDQMVVMHQNWHHLLFLHWEIPPEALQALVPPQLTIDTYQGQAYVALVPFTITGVRTVLTPPLPWISSFHEVNVRTYVHHEGRNPGVWFFSLDAASALAVAAARAMYHLPYFDADMSLHAGDGAFPEITFDSKRTDHRGQLPANAHVRYQPGEGAVQPAQLGSLEHFLVERYILYAQDDRHTLYRARVHHQPYPVQCVELLGLEETLVWAAGIRRPESAPLQHYAREVNVKVYGLEKV
jgi:uncharacterized protein YqjF (DUF2071 family)